MAFIEKKKRRWGDRRDGVYVRELPGLNAVLGFLFPKRTQSEVFMEQEIDITELVKYLEEKNSEGREYKITLFHCIVTILARVLNERRKLNRFVQGGRTYERDEITLGFVAKRRFTDHSEESLMLLKAEHDDTLFSISKRIVGDVRETRSRETTEGIDNVLDIFGKMPRLLLMFIVKTVRVLDYWGKAPKALTEGDMNFASISISNLGSIKCPSVYHHLNDYGTTSIFVTIGTIHKSQKVMEDGSVQIRDVVDLGITVDERIADGFYFARSFKLLNYICSNPHLLELPLEEESNYEYK